jgi:hypothetical protein
MKEREHEEEEEKKTETYVVTIERTLLINNCFANL